ncbi:PREDICTED: uncharacterized protein LOC109483490 [Branchiostoma belcheri]|uniref:Uncharacterized protein LOC109483490 n=1 Tax=Branchiostoma belcheri TaxID=7741 RepID=A0A6P5AFQ0_BRABE|nr:PREDICTED: uncharacterized protein LOC109483490 [Branchiostoma belcheri]
MSEAPTLSEETVLVPDVADKKAEETSRLETPSQTSSKECDAKSEPVPSVEEVQGVSATKIPPANFNDCTVETADEKEENLEDGKVCDSTSCMPGLLEEPLTAELQIKSTLSSANAESPGSRDSLALSRHGTADAPSPLEATLKPPASNDCTDQADGKEEISEPPKVCDHSPRTCIPGLLEESQIQPTVSSANAESPERHDSLASSRHGVEDAPSPLEALRAHLQAMVQDERDFVHTLNSKLTKLEGVVRHVRQEKNNLAAEFQDLEEHVDKLNGGVRAFDAEMRDYSLEKERTDNLTEAELRRTDSQLSFADIPEIGVNFSTSGQRARRGLWSRGKRWWRKKSGKVTPEKEDDIRELAADAAIKLAAFLREKL